MTDASRCRKHRSERSAELRTRAAARPIPPYSRPICSIIARFTPREPLPARIYRPPPRPLPPGVQLLLLGLRPRLALRGGLSAGVRVVSPDGPAAFASPLGSLFPSLPPPPPPALPRPAGRCVRPAGAGVERGGSGLRRQSQGLDCRAAGRLASRAPSHQCRSARPSRAQPASTARPFQPFPVIL